MKINNSKKKTFGASRSSYVCVLRSYPFFILCQHFLNLFFCSGSVMRSEMTRKKKMTFTSKQDSSKAACFVSRNIRMEKYRSKSNLEMDWHTVSLQSSSFELLCINRSMEIVDTYLRRLIDWKICIGNKFFFFIII